MSHFLKIYREGSGMSQMELARLLGISPSLLCMIEGGTRTLRGKAAARFQEMRERETAFPIDDYGTMEQAVTNILESYKLASHQNLSDREGSLLARLHKLTIATRELKAEYDRVKNEFRYLQILDGQYKKGEMPVTLQNKCVADRLNADTLLRAILNKKPELKLAEMEGIIAELKYLKKALKTRGNIFDSTVDSFLAPPPAELPSGEADPDTKPSDE